MFFNKAPIKAFSELDVKLKSDHLLKPTKKYGIIWKYLHIVKFLIVTLVIFGGSRVGLWLAENDVSLIWPPTGISLASFLLWGNPVWLGVLLGVLLAHISVETSWGFLLAAIVSNTVQPWLATQFLNHWQIKAQLHRIKDVLGFLLLGVIIPPLLGAFVGTTILLSTTSLSWQQFFWIAIKWAVGDGMGVLIFAPLILSWAHDWKQLQKQPLIAITGLSLLVAVNLFVFGVINQELILNQYPLEFLCFPLLIWAGVWFQQIGATTAIFVTSVIAIAATAGETGPFLGVESPTVSLFLLWCLIIVIAIPTLLLSAAVAERQSAQQHLQQLAYYDSLTGLLNRSTFLEHLENYLNERQTNHDNLCGILFIDLNHFKEINDSLGHSMGNELLQQVAARLQSIMDKDQTLARLGGDEFGVLVEHLANREAATVVAEKILAVLDPPFILQNYEYDVTATIGIAYTDNSRQSSEELLRDADIAMYHARTQQQSYCEFHPLMREKVISHLAFKQQLNQAIFQQELSLRYQPIIDLTTDKLLGFETLIRWHNSSQGQVSPAKFIPIAEETGFICQLGEWIIHQACYQLQQWQQQFSYPLTISVNVSPKQLGQPQFAKKLKRIIDTYGIACSQLELEITETAVLELTSYQVFDELKALGFGLYIDDFGMGHSSLSRLHQLPFDVIKIDRSFIKGIPSNHSQAAVIQTIISLANTMNFKLIAEGIETHSQKDPLLAWGCSMGQGFLFGTPLTAEAATNVIEQQIALQSSN